MMAFVKLNFKNAETVAPDSENIPIHLLPTPPAGPDRRAAVAGEDGGGRPATGDLGKSMILKGPLPISGSIRFFTLPP